MNIIIFSLTILACCGIILFIHKEWKEADVDQKMKDIVQLEELETRVTAFKKEHKGNINKKKETIDKFIKE